MHPGKHAFSILVKLIKMAGIFNGPPRGGTRGGRGEFSWENVKSDKDREYYLGHSVKALAGRWQKGKVKVPQGLK